MHAHDFSNHNVMLTYSITFGIDDQLHFYPLTKQLLNFLVDSCDV